MLKTFAATNLRLKFCVLFLCVVVCVSCQKGEEALQNDAVAKAEIARVNQVLQIEKKISQKDFDSVKAIYEKYPSSESARKVLQNAFAQRDDWASLEKFYSEISLSNLSEPEKINFAKVYIKLGRYEDSIKTLKAIGDESNVEIKALLAKSYFHLGKYDEAKTELDGSWEQIVKEKRIEEIALRGIIYFYEKENEKAIETFNKGLEIDSKHVLTNNSLSRVYAAQGNTEKAEEYVTKVKREFDAITAREKVSSAKAEDTMKIQAAYKAKRFEEVINLANRMLPSAKAREKVILYQFLVNSYQATGRTKQAQEALAKAKQIQQ